MAARIMSASLVTILIALEQRRVKFVTIALSRKSLPGGRWMVQGQFVVKTVVKTTVCEICKGLRLSSKPHFCPRRKGRRVGVRQVLVLAKHQTVLVTSA